MAGEKCSDNCKRFINFNILRLRFGALFELFVSLSFWNYRDRKRHINVWHINNFSVTPVTDPPGRVPDPPGRVPGRKCLCSLGSAHSLGIRLPLTGAEIPKIGKRGFRSQKTPISHHPRKGCSESKNPHFPCGALYRNGDFLTRSALFWGGGKWGFFDSETLFSRFWGFRPL